jgi:hypothetical protein
VGQFNTQYNAAVEAGQVEVAILVHSSKSTASEVVAENGASGVGAGSAAAKKRGITLGMFGLPAFVFAGGATDSTTADDGATPSEPLFDRFEPFFYIGDVYLKKSIKSLPMSEKRAVTEARDTFGSQRLCVCVCLFGRVSEAHGVRRLPKPSLPVAVSGWLIPSPPSTAPAPAVSFFFLSEIV